MERNEIWRSYGTDYSGMTKRLLEHVDLASRIPRSDSRIAIKPNLVTPSPAEYGGTTHPEIITGIIEYLKEHGFRQIVIAEGSWVGDRTEEAFTYCGYRDISRKYNIPLIDTQKEKGITHRCGGDKITICRCVEEWDYLINVPVLKGHCQTHVTCALKNLKGLIPNAEKRRFHTMGLHHPIALLNTVIRPDFIVIDHICGDPDFEEGGSPLIRNCIMASLDPVLTDAYACSLLGYRTDEVAYVGLAEKLGAGSSDLSSLRLITCEGEPEEDEPFTDHLLDVSYAVDDSDSCSACYAALIPALDRLRAEGLLEHLTVPLAIGQGHRKKTGPLGVGNCTRGYERYIPGCPPDEEQIYLSLRKYLTEKL